MATEAPYMPSHGHPMVNGLLLQVKIPKSTSGMPRLEKLSVFIVVILPPSGLWHGLPMVDLFLPPVVVILLTRVKSIWCIFGILRVWLPYTDMRGILTAFPL